MWAEPAGLILGPPARSGKVPQALILSVFGCAGSSLPHWGSPLVAAGTSASYLWSLGFSLRWLLLWTPGPVGFRS